MLRFTLDGYALQRLQRVCADLGRNGRFDEVGIYSGKSEKPECTF
jgi:hypothetical protein